MSSILKFERDRLITGINIIDGMLFFTDNKTEPKKINIEAFRNADHSTGTTSIYGRQFQERDITVIRPAPMETLKTSISTIDPDFNTGDGVTPYATSPDVLTKSFLVINQTKVNLLGWTSSIGANITSVGFYYIKKDTAPTENEISEGTKVSADSLNGGNFSSKLTDLTANTRYYFVAYGYNSIGQEILADNILTFKTEKAQASKAAPTVTTVQPLKQSPGKYQIIGKVTDLGGSELTEASFWVFEYNLLDNITKPSTLVDYSGAKKLSARYNPSSGEYYFNLSASDLFYVEFYASNEIGDGVGGVKGNFGATGGESTLLKPEVRYITNEVIRESTISVKITGQVTKQNGQISERGFYLSKTESNLSINWFQHEAKPDIFKIKVPFDALNVTQEYTLDTSDVSGLTINAGDTLYVMPYAYNGVQGQGDNVPIHISSNSSTDKEPLVETLSLNKKIQSSDVVIGLGVNVISNGYNNETSGLTDLNGVSSLGCIIYKGKFNEFSNFTDEEKETKILSLLASNKAFKYTFTVIDPYGVIFGIDSAINATKTGRHTRNYDGDSGGIAPIDEGHEYYVIGFASNASKTGYGKVKSIQIKETAEIVPEIGTVKVFDNTTNFDKTFYGRLIKWDDDQPNIYDAGFTVSVYKASSFDINTGTQFSLLNPTSDGAAVEGSSVSKINTAIGANNKNNAYWAIKVSDLYNTIQQDTDFRVQAWVQMESGGVKHPAQFEGEGNVKEDGIISFKNTGPSSPQVAPKVKLYDIKDTSIGAKGFNVIGLVTTSENENADTALTYATSGNSQTGIFYAETSDVPSGTDATKASWIRTNGSVVRPSWNWQTEPDRRFSYEFGGQFDDGLTSSNNVQLSSNTEYSVVAWVGNPTGENHSNIVTAKTTEDLDVWVLGYLQSGPMVTHNSVSFSYKIQGNGDKRMNSGKLYYIEKSNISANPTSKEITEDPDASYIDNETFSGATQQSQSSTKIVENLEPGTEYWFVWKMDFVEYGLKYSDKVGVKTKGGLPESPDSTISVPSVFMFFDGNGNEITEKVEMGGYDDAPPNCFEVVITPNNSDYDVKKGSGDWSHMHVAKKTSNGSRYVCFTPTQLYPGFNDRRWTASIYNTINPSELVQVSLRQTPMASYPDPHYNYLENQLDSLDGNNGLGSGSNTSSGGGSGAGIGKGSLNKILEDGPVNDDGDATWDVNIKELLK